MGLGFRGLGCLRFNLEFRVSGVEGVAAVEIDGSL